MSPIAAPRNSCVLQGAARTTIAIGGVVPIVHSTAGCALQSYLAGCLASGGQGAGQIGGLTFPATNIIEKHVIFGGSSRLREQIKNTVHVLEGKLYLVISGCAPDLVGDDSEAMTKEIKEQGYPAAYLQASGFLGNAYQGYQMVVKTIIDFVAEQIEKPPGKIKGLVNIFGVVPGQDSFWQGDLMQLSQSFSAVGLAPNPLFGAGQTIENWKKALQGELNLVVSPWGVEIAQYLEEKFGIPYINWLYLPVGVDDIRDLLLEVSKRIELDGRIVEKVAHDADAEFNYFLEQFADAYFNFNFQVEFSAVGPISQVLGVSRFLVNVLGLSPKALVFTDSPPNEPGAAIDKFLAKVTGKPRLLFSEDSKEIFDFLKQEKANLILASALEKDIAAELGSAHLSISFPVGGRIILNRGYSGYTGGLNLMEDVGTAIIRNKMAEFETVTQK